eukprot:m.356228 g.356228  ORF g.356228 m.356228 type:complete len:80 (-) comp16604_c0_seq7:8030-8269(-)
MLTFFSNPRHIPVAIKILLHPIDDLDESSKADFDREVDFMRSVRHPHILTFFGGQYQGGGALCSEVSNAIDVFRWQVPA